MSELIHFRPTRQSQRRQAWRWGSEAAFTLVELMVATAVFTLVMGSILYLYVFSARAISGVNRQLELNTQARVVNAMINEIKSSQQALVETYDGTNFTAIPMGQLQRGNAVVLSVPNDVSNPTNTVQVYYWVNTSGKLYRARLNSGNSKLFLDSITNSFPFSLQNYKGVIQSNLLGRTYIDVNFYCYDPNTRNFRQAMFLQCGAQQRN